MDPAVFDILKAPAPGNIDVLKATGIVSALVSIVGFAIQQALQGLDAFVSAGIDVIKARRKDGTLPGHLTDADFKKSVMAVFAFLVGLGAVSAVPQLRLLQYVGIDNQVLDTLLSALVLGAGTEGANTVLKYFGYVKDARKKPDIAAIAVEVLPRTVTVPKGTSFTFLAKVTNGDAAQVAWKVLSGAGGSIDPQGTYAAPSGTGTFQIAAVSTMDPSAVGLATVTVS
jgi:hypothetical protein